MRLHRVSRRIRYAAASALAAGLMIAGGCSTGPEPADPATLGFQNYYMCAFTPDVVDIGKRANAQECLTACETASKQLLIGTAKACWWLDGSGGVPQDCRLCKSIDPVKDVFFNNWTKTLTPAGKSDSPH